MDTIWASIKNVPYKLFLCSRITLSLIDYIQYTKLRGLEKILIFLRIALTFLKGLQLKWASAVLVFIKNLEKGV